MTILVTGGTGYIGSHTVVELMAAGREVFLIDNFCNSKASVIERIQRIAGRRPGDIAQCYADASLALATLGWRAELGVDAMCADTWRWQRWAAENLSR
jgi:UDP-glucose 4-epimerase